MQNNVLEYLENSVDKFSDKICFCDNKTAFTFAEVYAKARAIGSSLLRNGVKNKPVVVFIKKSPQAIVSFLGCLYAGCYYVPMDDEMPAHRIELIFKTLGDCAVITDARSLKNVNNAGKTENIFMFDGLCGGEADDSLLNDVREKQIDTDPIYIVFTSGSTGVPKGVCACHRSVIDYIEHFSEVMAFTSDTVFGNQAPLYTDACLKEIYPTLKFGATDVLIPKMNFSFPVKLVEFLNEYKINTICWVASALTLVSSLGTFDTVKPQYLRTVAFSSEVFAPVQYNIWKSVLPEARFINLYGPTECTGISCYYEVKKEIGENGVIPIGKPFKNTAVMLLDDDRKLSDTEGEICIRGTALTLGYYRNFEKTNECFIQNPLNDMYPEYIYLTGDIGKYDENGDLVFVSRKDFQVKHMGYRIELGEIEAVGCNLEGVSMTACIYDKDNKKIVYFYTGTPDEDSVLGFLKKKLPRYMIPAVIKKLDVMPRTLNGKIDRVGLKKEYM